jgi:hypothetical protein
MLSKAPWTVDDPQEPLVDVCYWDVQSFSTDIAQVASLDNINRGAIFTRAYCIMRSLA